MAADVGRTAIQWSLWCNRHCRINQSLVRAVLGSDLGTTDSTDSCHGSSPHRLIERSAPVSRSVGLLRMTRHAISIPVKAYRSEGWQFIGIHGTVAVALPVSANHTI